MADNNELQAKSVFDTLCAALDQDDWNYQKDTEKLEISCTARGEDLPIELIVQVSASKGVVSLFSPIPVKVPEDKRVDLAVAVAIANNGTRWGNFDYIIQDGHIFFRMAACFLDSLLGAEFFLNMMYTACGTVDKYNDRFLMLAKDMMNIEKFIALENQ